MDTGSGDSHDALDNIFLGCIDRVRGPEFARKLEPLCVEIDADDDRRPNHASRHDGCQSNRPGAKGSKRLSHAHLQTVDHGPGARLNTAGQRAQALKGNLRRHLHHIAFGAQRVAGERRLPEKITVNSFFALGKRRGAIRLGCRRNCGQRNRGSKWVRPRSNSRTPRMSCRSLPRGRRV